MRVELGNVPDHEPCEFLSTHEALSAANAYIECLRRFCGEPPLGSDFKIEKDPLGWFTVVFMAAPNEEAQEYANLLVSSHPLTFSGIGSKH